MSIDHLPLPAAERQFTPIPLPPVAGPAWRPVPRPWSPTPAARASLWLHGIGLCALAAWPAGWPWVAGALAADHAILGLAGMWPRSRMLGPNLLRLPEHAGRRGEITLTFDDGPDPAITPQVLDLLEAHGATASFFLIGRRALRYPDLAREILRRGHDIENHTHRHPYGFACWRPGAMRREIMAAQRAIADTVGAEPRFFRPPLGLRSPLLDPALAASGLDYVSWTRRGLDGRSGDPAAVLRRLTRGLAAGDILLLHDADCARSPGGRPVVLEVLPALLARIRALGLRPVSLRRALDGPAGAATAAAAAAPACPAPAGHACR
jgi:peptidoglycan/xylan/chitin deacetylase (PgdA/CDA1 family)